MDKPVVLVITGGDTDERSGSLSSAQDVYDAISDEYPTVLVDLHEGRWSLLKGPEDVRLGSEPPKLISRRTGETIVPDLAFLSIHGYPGESGELQGYLDILGIPYTGSRVLASSLAQDKFRCKVYLGAALDLPMPRQHRLGKNELSRSRFIELGINPPFVVKPNSLGSGIGVVSVRNEGGIDSALALLNALHCETIVEELIEGVEVTAGAIRTDAMNAVFDVAEVVRKTDTSLDFTTYTSRRDAELIIPARIPGEVERLIRRHMVSIGEALDLRGCYRADFIIRDGVPFFLEVNSVPGMSSRSVLILQAEASGVSRKQLMLAMVKDGLGRNSI